jgi:poly(3-hydroxybutyrate) depolymerase
VRCGWNSGFPDGGGCQTPASPRPDDVGFAERILGWMSDNLCVDTQRIFMAGFSNGAQMVYKLNCELSQHFAGMMTLGMGARSSTIPDLAECRPQRKISSINLCGSLDGVSDCFDDGGVTAQVHAFAQSGQRCQNGYKETNCGCQGIAIDLVRTDISNTSFCVAASGCPGFRPVEGCTIEGLGHCWSSVPGAGDLPCQNQNADNLDASTYVLDFFDRTVVPEYTTRRVVYGKYFKARCSDDSPLFECNRLPPAGAAAQDYDDNSYWLHSPSNIAPGVKLPIMVQFHGGGFTGGSATREIDNTVQGYLDNGFHYLSVNYRLVNQLYLFADSAGEEEEEEYIHAREDYTLTLDAAGRRLSEYAVKVGRTEFNTKCSYDAAQALEHLIAHADELQVDLHKMSLSGSSAGGGEIHYLAWGYHSLEGSAPRYTPVSMSYAGAQLDYPVQNMLDRVYGLWAHDIGGATPISTILSFDDCVMVVGNPWCDAEFVDERLAGGDLRWQSSTRICNPEWHAQAMAQYCATEELFDAATIGDLQRTQVWPMGTEQDRGIAALWYTSGAMASAASHLDVGAFYLFVVNRLNTTAGMNVVHSAMHARQYARVAERAGMNYATLYTDYHGMTADDYGDSRYTLGDLSYNVLSSFAPAANGLADWTQTKLAHGWQANIVGSCGNGWSDSTDTEGTCAGLDSLLFVCSGTGARKGATGAELNSGDCHVPAPPPPYSPGSGGADWRREVIGPEYVDALEMQQSDDIPVGDLYHLTFSSTDSNIYPGIAKDDSQRPEGVSGSRFVSIGPLDPSQSLPGVRPYERQVVVYVPKQLSRQNPAPLLVCQDGLGYVSSLAPTLDALIADGRAPAMVGVMIDSGGSDAQGSQRGLEYDTVSSVYAAFVESEVLPRIAAELGLEFTTDPGARAAMGGSSGAAAAFTMAWHRPDLYSKVLSYSGTFVHQQSPYDPASPRGAWEYAATMIPASQGDPWNPVNAREKNIRVWMHVGDGDLGVGLPESTLHNWPLANDRLADALEAKGYDYHYVYSVGSGHVDRRVVRQTLAGALEWLWRDSPLLPGLPLADYLATPYGGTNSAGEMHLAGRQTAHIIPGVIGYQLYLPRGYTPASKALWPVIYHLHGSGESEGRYTRGGLADGGTFDLGINTIESVKAHGLPHAIEGRDLPFIVVSPQAPAHARGGWGGSAIDALERLAATVEAELSVDPDRVYLTGLSMGGSGTWTWAAAHPERFAAIAPVRDR